MVNADWVKRKIPILLVNSATTTRKGKNEQMRKRYRFTQLKKRKPERFNSLNNQLLKLLEEIDCELENVLSEPLHANL
jgi:hypothetical protein